MSIGSRIKDLREEKGLSRPELAELLNVTVGSISNYENGISSPKEPILFKIIETLGCDANYLFQDVVKIKERQNDVTLAEYEHIKKYRDLDPHGREMVDFTLNKEYERSIALKESEEQDSNIVDMQSHLQTNAANRRTDIDIPEGVDTSEDDIMDSDEF
ncbi:MAG: helix-turn-helix domain-containing protein [Lachnospiraceae bacterium]